MSFIVNGTEIPANGDYIKAGDTLVDKVVCNGVTVWEKLKEKYIAAAYGIATLYSSDDGITWSENATGIAPKAYTDIIYFNGSIYGWQINSNVIYYIPFNGISWNSVTISSITNIRGMYVYKDIVIIVGYMSGSGLYQLFYTSDFVSFTQATSLTSTRYPINFAQRDNELLYICCSGSGCYSNTAGTIMLYASSDGKTWTYERNIFDTSYGKATPITYQDGRFYLLSGNSNNVPGFYYSTDSASGGYSFTYVNTNNQNYYCDTYGKVFSYIADKSAAYLDGHILFYPRNPTKAYSSSANRAETWILDINSSDNSYTLISTLPYNMPSSECAGNNKHFITTENYSSSAVGSYTFYGNSIKYRNMGETTWTNIVSKNSTTNYNFIIKKIRL